MTDFNSGNNGEKLIEQRNESSVLFSLDSLSNMSAESDESDLAFGGSGDKSGLIDLNTLAEMGSTGSDNDEFGGGAPVFNSVTSKSDKKKRMMLIGGVVLLVAIIIGVAAYFIMSSKEEADQALLAQEEAAKAAQEQLDKDAAERKALEQKIAELEADSKRRDVDAEELRKAKEELEAKQKQEAEDQKKVEETKKAAAPKASSGSSDSKSSGASAKPASGGKGPSADAVKSALQASVSKAQKCGKNGNLVVSMTLSGSGKAKNVSAVSGSFKGTPTEKCIITVVEKHNFPTFSGSDVSGVKYNYKL